MDGHTRRPGSPASRAERELLTMAALFTITIIAVLTHSVVSGPVRPSGLQASTLLAVGFSGQEHCSELPFPPPGDLLTQGLSLCLMHWQVDSLPLSHLGSPRLSAPSPIIFQLIVH